MCVRFLILDAKYYDGTKDGNKKAYDNALEITVSNASSVESVIKKYRKRYPADEYDFDGIEWK